MNTILTDICFRKRQGVIIPTQSNEISDVYLATILKNLESYGYTLSLEAIIKLKCLNDESAVCFYKELVETLKQSLGVVTAKPLYENFPKSVMDTDEGLLYLKAIIYYATQDKELLKDIAEERFPLIDKNSLKIINSLKEDVFEEIFKNLVTSKNPLSESDKNDVKNILSIKGTALLKNIHSEIPFKETLIFITNLLITENVCISEFIPLYKTATDVLRLATALSNGDISLKENCYFKSFKRAERRMLLTLLENAKNIEEDMLRNKNSWIRLGERLHPSEYKIFPKSKQAFNKLRNSIKINTFNSSLEQAFKSKDLGKIIELLSSRPGMFARNLDRLLRLDSSVPTVYSFGSIAKDIPTDILIQLYTHFKSRKETISERIFKPNSKFFIKNTELEKLPNETCEMVMDICKETMIHRFSQKSSLGKVFVDGDLSKFTLPLGQRYSSKSLKTLPTGTRISLPNTKKTIRSFIHWVGNDVDLSALVLDENFKIISQISYFHLKDGGINSCHSGDITYAPKGAMEYVDIDIESAKSKNARYILTTINSFSGEAFKDIENCFCGIMFRDEPTSGEIFEASTVFNKMDLTANSTFVLQSVIDLQEMEYISCDISLNTEECGLNVHSEAPSLIAMTKAITLKKFPLLSDLVKFNVAARGVYECDIMTAETIITHDRDNVELLLKQTVDAYNSFRADMINLFEKEVETLKDAETTEQKLKLDIMQKQLKDAKELKIFDYLEVLKSKTIITPYDTDIILKEFL